MRCEQLIKSGRNAGFMCVNSAAFAATSEPRLAWFYVGVICGIILLACVVVILMVYGWRRQP